jgi:hypothetical protein
MAVFFKILNLCQIGIKKISNLKNKTKYNKVESEKRLITNVVNSLASALQSLTISFRKAQNVYLESMKIMNDFAQF